MLTLGESISGGRDWHEFYTIFEATGPMDCFVFLCMLAFFHVAVWNIIASVFVESTLMSATIDREQQVLAQRRQDEKDAKEFMSLCQSADSDGSGTISFEEFSALMEEEGVQEFFKAKSLDVKDATYFFKMVEAMNDGKEIDLEDFVSVCLRMKGGATSIDLQTLAIEHKILAQKTKRFMSLVQTLLTNLSEKTDRLIASTDVCRALVQSTQTDAKLGFARLSSSAGCGQPLTFKQPETTVRPQDRTILSERNDIEVIMQSL
eukprot:TRINITY_DN29920_c0_g1_i5.p1 TRINITY_DN29920_c0_g1~~TRINITY_DN29920_c0_g1_i5.p1  ORF type:complete len:262 (-),score=57.57 TRINITY_DN29920_c0_g1_i5:94-879(-)